MSRASAEVPLHVLRVHYTGTEADSAPYTAAHVDYLRRHHADGTFLLSGQTVPSEDGGVIVACGVDRDAAEAIAAQDPVRRGRGGAVRDHHRRRGPGLSRTGGHSRRTLHDPSLSRRSPVG